MAGWRFWSREPTDHHSMARKEYNSKRYAQAEPHLQALLRANPNDEWAKDVLSRLYMNTSRHEKALPLLKSLGESGPDKAIFLHLLARCLFSMELVDESIEMLQQLIDAGEITDEGWELLERALRGNNDPEYAVEFWKNLSISGVISPQIDIQMIRIDIQEGNLNDAAKRITRITSVGGEVDLSPKLRLKLADILIQEGTPNTALEIVQSVEESIPERARIMANAKRALGDTIGALESVSEGFEHGSTHGLLFSALRLAWDLGSMEEVVEHANKIILDKPEQRTAHSFRLRALVKIGDLTRIREAISDTLVQIPDFIQAHRVMIDLGFSELEDWEMVISHCDEVLKVLPDDRRSLCNIALSQLNLGRHQQAVDTINHATAMHPEDDEVGLTAAKILWTIREGGHLDRINSMLSRYDIAPVFSSDNENSIAIEHLFCDVQPSNDSDGPLVSIIMTAYGRDEYLDVAINSILSQTHQNIELIIVDDCSPDDAYEYLLSRSEHEPRLRVMQVAENGGTYLAKNSAITHAKGEYIGFMDSDDWTHPQRIERQLAVLINDPNCRAVCHSYFRVNEFGDIFYKGTGAIRLACISLLAERSVFDIIGHFDSLRVGADTEFIERIQAYWGADSLCHDPIPSMFMLNHSSSLTGGGPFQISWRSITGPRLEHHSSFRAWHKKIRHGGADPYVDFPLRVRPFEVPKEMETGSMHWRAGDILFSELIQSRENRWWKNGEQIWQRELSDKENGQQWATEFGVRVPNILWSSNDLNQMPSIDELPSRVVIKPSKGYSAHNVLCLDNGVNILDGKKWNDSDIKEAFSSDKFLQRVKPLWMVEEFLRPELWREDEKVPRDWKFYCFGEDIALIHAVLRNSTVDKQLNSHHYFTPDLRQIRHRISQSRLVPDEPLFFPDCWDEMIQQVKLLGKQLKCFMRIDMYATNEGPVFGEFTPTPEGGSGFTEWADRYLATFWKGVEGVED